MSSLSSGGWLDACLHALSASIPAPHGAGGVEMRSRSFVLYTLTVHPQQDPGLVAFLSARLEAAKEDIAQFEAQSEKHRRAFSDQVAKISEKYIRENGRLSHDSVELFAVHRKLVAELLDDSVHVGQAKGRREALAEVLQLLVLGE
jgi:hypothetical protein